MLLLTSVIPDPHPRCLCQSDFSHSSGSSMWCTLMRRSLELFTRCGAPYHGTSLHERRRTPCYGCLSDNIQWTSVPSPPDEPKWGWGHFVRVNAKLTGDQCDLSYHLLGQWIYARICETSSMAVNLAIPRSSEKEPASNAWPFWRKYDYATLLEINQLTLFLSP